MRLQSSFTSPATNAGRLLRVADEKEDERVAVCDSMHATRHGCVFAEHRSPKASRDPFAKCTVFSVRRLSPWYLC